MKNQPTVYRLFVALTLLLAIPCSGSATNPGCEGWFLGTGAEPGTRDCETKCAIAGVGMDSFMCPLQCRDLCKLFLDKLTVEQLTYQYALTKSEKKLIQKRPKEAALVFYAKYLSEKSSRRIFGPIPKHNNEADAFRHYVWSGRLAHFLGEQKARLFLEAHEDNPEDPKEEREMDLHNNERGLKQGIELDQKNKFSSEALERAALESLRNKTLKVMRPTGKVPEWK